MTRPRFSLGGLMIWIAVAGGEIALVRWAIANDSNGELSAAVAIASPMLILLGFGFYRAWRYRPASPFWQGFLPVGSLTTIAIFGLVWSQSSQMEDYEQFVVGPAVTAVQHGLGQNPSAPGKVDDNFVLLWSMFIPLMLVLYALPAFVPALLSGWLCSRYEFKISVSRRRPATMSEPIAEDSSLVSGAACDEVGG